MSRELSETLGKHWKECVEWLRYRDYSAKSIKVYDRAFRAFRVWVESAEGLRELTDLTTAELQSYLVYLSLRDSRSTRKGASKKKLSASTRGCHLSSLRHLFAHLYSRRLILVNPTHEIEWPKRQATLPRTILTVDEMLRILAAAESSGRVARLRLRNRAALELLYTTGIRRSELESLTLAAVRLGERLAVIEGKGGKQRLVPIGVEAVRCLVHYLEQSRPRFRAAGSAALFLSAKGGAMKARTLADALKSYARKAGVTKPVDLHTIRHTCATHLLAGGADIRYIQELLGHSSLKSTQVYTRVEMSDLRRMLETCHPREKF
jgi:integrase/recombinase XerD